ncbi:MAG: GNAT family N-acetyltransferase [Bacillota bacterium]
MKTRPVIPGEDDSFLFDLFASTKRDEMSNWGWNEKEQFEFLQMQFHCQRQSYQIQYPGLKRRIILSGDVKAGVISIAITEAGIDLVDIALLPEFRGRGAGSGVIKELLGEAADSGLPVRLSVLRGNPAMRLYDRLGFTAVGGNDLYIIMKWDSEVRNG